MKGSRHHPRHLFAAVLTLSFLAALVASVSAQSAPSQATDPDSIQRRIVRARALAAAGNLPAARSELESLRNAPTDESTREITLVLLMGIYFEQSDYAYAENLLNDAFRARAQQNEAATRSYYLLAGRTINGVRSQLDRYRAFGLDASDQSLPPEAVAHLDRLRKLIEHVVEQGRQLRDESTHGIDAAALLENASSARVLLARNDSERAQWQREVADVRQKLTGVERGAPSPALVVTQKPAPTQPALGVTQAVPEPTPATTTNAPTTNTPTAGAPASTNGTATAQRAQQEGAHASAPNAGQTQTPASNPAGEAVAVEVGSLISRAAQTIAPGYPAAARAARIGGKVTVYLLVDEKGEVAAVQRSDGPEMLRRAAEDAARRWRFRQTVINGQPARVTGFVTFNFAP
ncbi:MAG: periplasmic protein TonB [Acidobacteriota bacterium]|nr:periplasmic protein TonB [Acidobacteriota bacterium]